MNKLKSFNKNSKVLSISDSDLDGAGAQIVLGNSLKNLTLYKASYANIDEMMKSVNYKEWDFVILTDITPHDHTLMDLSDNIILLDHHDSAADLHCPEKMRSVIRGHCSAYWTKKFCEDTLKVNLKYLDNLIYLIEDYDMWHLKNDKSRFLNVLFYKYYSEKFQRRFFSGDTRFTKEEISFIRKRKKDFRDIYENLEVYTLDSINGCFIQCTQFHNDICHKLLNDEKYNVVILRNPQNKKVSMRNNCPEVHIGNILKELDIGGGHKDAGGFVELDMESLQKKLLAIENKIFETAPSIRK